VPLDETRQAAPRFHKLRIADLRQETRDAISLAFEIPTDLRAAFTYRPGQYLTLRAMPAGVELRRSYSICSGLDDGELRIAIKRVPGGSFSPWAHTELSRGDVVEVMPPEGRFGAPIEPSAARTHVAFAAGSGITPMLSILRTVLAREVGPFVLFYGNRSSADVMFRETLEDLKDRHLGRLSVFHVLSREQQDVKALNGRLDADKARLLLPRIVPPGLIDHAYICGPGGMIETLSGALSELGVPPGRIHVERFSPDGRIAPPPRPTASPAETTPHAIATVIADGKRNDVPVAADEAVLEAALRAGLDLPWSCRGGMCSTCRARLLEGTVQMRQNYALEPWELEAGYVLTCQAVPTSARVVVDYDHV
jgi:ring-1,2-phenylacetyl-CoA epoxidase subunit PaaE